MEGSYTPKAGQAATRKIYYEDPAAEFKKIQFITGPNITKMQVYEKYIAEWSKLTRIMVKLQLLAKIMFDSIKPKEMWTDIKHHRFVAGTGPSPYDVSSEQL